MDIGIATSSLNQLNTEDAVKAICELGVKVEIDFSTFYEFRPEFSKKLAGDFSPYAECVLSRRPVFEELLLDMSRRVRGDFMYWTDQLMRSCKLLGCGNYAYRGVLSECGMDELASYLEEARKFCAHYGVSFLLANKADGVYYKPGIFKEMKNRCPELYGVFDMTEAQKSSYPVGMYIEDMRSSLAVARVNTNGDLKEVIARLKDAGFDGTVVLDTDGEIAPALETLRKLI